LSSRRSGRSTRSTTAHCSSVSSQRPVTALCGYPRAAPGSHKNASQVFMRLVLDACPVQYCSELLYVAHNQLIAQFSRSPLTVGTTHNYASF
jgi:hypothetical protein